MKKIFITAILFSSLSVSVFATDGGKKKDNGNSEAVSYNVLNQFTYDFKDAKEAVWTVNGNCQKADFLLGGQKMTAFYSLSGEYLGTTRYVAFKNVPAAAQKEISTEYASYQVGEVVELEPRQVAQTSDLLASSAYSNDSKVYFVDLKNDKEEILVRVTPSADVYFFKQVK